MVIAELTVRPGERMLTGPNGSASLEPLVMTLLLELAAQAGTLVSRRTLFSKLWGGADVADDNLNRLVAALRRSLVSLGVTSVDIHTIPAAGYVLRFKPEAGVDRAAQDVEQAISQGRESWRLAWPEPDHLRIALLDRAGEISPREPTIFGLLALLHRHAAEYSSQERASQHVHDCEAAALRGLQLDPTEVQAATALVGVAPLYGHWFEAGKRLQELCTEAPGHPVPENELSVLEMATGQVKASKRRRDLLISGDPLAAGFAYKSAYQHWSVGDHAGMNHIADRAMQLWPLHPAVWTVRFWTLAYTDRLAAAEAMLGELFPRGFPVALLHFFQCVIAAVATGGLAAQDAAAAAAVRLAANGPAHAVTALFALGLLGRTQDGFAVARRYYLQEGAAPVPLQPGRDHPQLNEQHRRVTQILFTPACAGMRADPQFAELCHSVGLTDFWERSGITPDFLV